MNSVSSRVLIDRGRALLESRRIAEAAAQFSEVVLVDPSNAEAWHFLGVCNASLGARTEAERCLRQSISKGSSSPHTYHNLAVLLLEGGNTSEAARNFREAIERKPDFLDSHLGLSKALEQQGDLSSAAACCERSIRETGGFPGLFAQLGKICAKLEQFDRAERGYREAILRDMADADTYRNLAISLAMQGRLEEAAQNYEKALAINERDSEAAHNLGLILSEFGQSMRAIGMLRRTIAIDSSNVSALNDIARELGEQGQYAEAIEIYRKLHGDHPDEIVAANNFLYTLNYDPALGAQTIFEEHARWGEQWEQRAPVPSSNHPNLAEPARRLRIGYVSADFRAHSVAYFFEPVLTHHDKSRFEVFCYSTARTVDETTDRIRSAASHWRPLHGLDDTCVFDQIRRDQIDILVDLSGHTAGNRLGVFVQKPAPVQASYLGYANTTGLRAMDYRFTDNIADPPDQDRFYCEALVRLPGCFCCYRPPEHAPPVSSLPATRNAFVTFAALVNLVKINEPTIEVWSEIMRAVPNSRLVLQAKVFVDPAVRSYWVRRFANHGVTAERLVLRPYMDLIDHLALYRDIDIALDTFPWSSHTTACHALWMGVPVVTLAGERHASRMAASVLAAVGYPEFAATSTREYVRLAVDLARDGDRLTSVRGELRQRVANSLLCDATTFTRGLESKYREMWERWCAVQNSAPAAR